MASVRGVLQKKQGRRHSNIETAPENSSPTMLGQLQMVIMHKEKQYQAVLEKNTALNEQVLHL